MSDEVMAIQAGDIIVYVKTASSLWARFYGSKRLEFEDIIARFNQSRQEEDIFWLSSSEDNFFLLGLLWDEDKREATGMLCLVPDRLDDINEEYWALPKDNFSEGSFRAAAARRLYARLKDSNGLGLPPDFPFFCENDTSGGDNKILLVKLPLKDERLKLVPFDALSECKLGRFGKYKATRYIVSNRSALVLWEEQQQLKKMLANDEVFLSGTVIMVNNYRHFYEDDDNPSEQRLLCCAVSYIKELADCFRTVNFNGKEVHLRFRFDASVRTLLDDLANEDTLFVYADFHTVGYEWVVEKEGGDNFFEEVMRLRLDHIKLMRIFHCFSGKADKGRESIAAQFIAKKVGVVEGSAGTEKFKSFLYTVIHTLIIDRQTYVEQYEWMSGKPLLRRGKVLLRKLERSGIQLR